MIISESHRFVFLHNPKCGGMTIRRGLEKYDTTGQLFWGKVEFDTNSAAKEHMPLELFRRLFPNYYSMLADFFVFVFVRNPYSRAISAFNQIHSKSNILQLAHSDDPAKVGEYRSRLNDFYAKLGEPAVRGHSIFTRHLVRQRDIIYLDEKCLADVILRTDQWEQSLEQLGVFRPDLAADIASKGRRNAKPVPESSSAYFEPRAIERINRLYRDDFLLFGYPMMAV